MRRLNLSIVIVSSLTLFLTVLTAHRVFATPLWGDEFRTWRDGIEKPLTTVLTWKHNPDHAPLGHLLARTGAAIFGVDHAWALRLGAWLCGLACVPAIGWMGRTLSGNSAVGCVMAAMLVVDPNISLQITQARMYPPMLLAAIVAMTLAGSILLRPQQPWRRATALGIALGVGIWSHSQIYAVLIALLVVAIDMLFRDRRKAAVLFASIAIGCSIGAQGIIKIASRHDAETIESADVKDPPGGQLEDAANRVTGKNWITIIVAVSTIAGFVVLARRPDGHSLVAFLSLIVAMAIVDLLVAARYRPVAHPRYLMILQPPLWLAAATLVVELCRSPHRYTFGVASGLTLAGLSIFEFTRSLNALEMQPLAEPFAIAARAARQSIAPTDRFITVARQPYAMYSRYYGFTQDATIDDAISPSPSKRLARSRIAAAELDRGTVWLLCIVPPPNIKYRDPLDDPQTIVGMIADARNVAFASLPELARDKAWRATLVKIVGDKISVIATTDGTK